MKKLNKNTVDKPQLPVTILQFGTGNFLRAFVDWMVEKSNAAGLTNHGIAIVQSSTTKSDTQKLFEEQDYLYHVYLEGTKEREPIKEVTLVKNIVDLVNATHDYDNYREHYLGEELKIVVSNTTEAGIRYVEGDDIFAHPPQSFPAKMTALLYERYKKFEGAPEKGLHIVCTELIEDNGSTLKRYILKHAEHFNLEEGFTNWVESACCFYDTLVDRIVPGFPRENIDEVKAELGFDDNLVVKGEYFHVWAIGGEGALKELLPFDRVEGLDVLFVEDISNFRDKKVRVLNGAHTAMVPVALQLGCETVMDAFNTPDVEEYIKRMVAEEVLPVIDEELGELQKFADSILERFYNPYLKHYLKDISLNSLSKWETRDYPTLIDNYTKLDKEAKLVLFSLSALLVLYSGKGKVEFEPNDTEEYVEFIRSTFDSNDIANWVKGVVEHKEMWSVDFDELPFVVEQTAEGVEAILEKGMAEALRELLN